METDDQQWLVKSSARILGPMTRAEIFKRLKTREIHLTDEVCRPCKRWQSIQVHPELKEILEEMRRMMVSEETEVSWTPNQHTQTATDLTGTDLTDELTDKISQSTRTGEIVIHDLVEERRVPIQSVGQARFQAGVLGKTSLAKKKAEQTTKWLWVGTLLVLVSAFFLILHRRGGNHESFTLSLESLRARIPQLVETGDYAEALKLLKDYYHDPLQSGELGIYMGPLLIQIDRQTTLGRRVLSQMASNQMGEPRLVMTGIGLADVIENQFDSALTQLNSVLAKDPQYSPALINAAAVYFRKNQLAKSKDLLRNILRGESHDGEAQMLYALVAAQLSKEEPQLLNDAISELGKYRTQQMDYEAEISFAQMYLDWLKHNQQISDEKLLSFLEVDPQISDDHRHNLFIYRDHLRWSELLKFCEEMSEKMGDQPRGATLRAVCYNKSGRKAEARIWIEKAVEQAPVDPLSQAWYSFILTENGLGDQASVALGRANELNRKGEYQLPMLLQGRFCEAANDKECTRAAWNRLLERNVRSLAAFAGLARFYANQSSYGDAASFIGRGLTVSPGYVPLLKLKLKGQRAGWYEKG